MRYFSNLRGVSTGAALLGGGGLSSFGPERCEAAPRSASLYATATQTLPTAEGKCSVHIVLYLTIWIILIFWPDETRDQFIGSAHPHTA